MVRTKRKLTEEDWTRVFATRCRSKQGAPLSEEDRALCATAFESDGARYSEMARVVFNATVPFGSTTRWK